MRSGSNIFIGASSTTLLPYEGKAHHPIDNRPIDYAKTEELLEYFRWARDEELDEIVVRERAHIEDEPADMAILLTYLCIDMRVDINSAMKRKIQKNDEKYPL